MKNKLLKAILLCSCLFIANSYAGGLQDHNSEIDDAGLWYIFKNGVTYSYEETDNSFFTHCNGKNRVYVSPVSSKANGFVCNTSKDKSGHSLYLEGFKGEEGIYTLTKNKLVDTNWEVTSPSKLELSIIKQKALRQISKKPYEINGDLKYKREIIYGKLLKYAKKITKGEFSLFVIPILTTETESDEPIITSIIFSSNNDDYRYGGQIEGIPSIGRDVDNDGFPEVLCVKYFYEGTVHDYYKIYPKVRVLMTNSSS